MALTATQHARTCHCEESVCGGDLHLAIRRFPQDPRLVIRGERLIFSRQFLYLFTVCNST